jgi:hypothetical protein
MQGLEILTVAQVATDYSFNTIGFLIAAIVVIGVFVAIGIEEMEVFPYCVGGLVAGLILGVLVGGITGQPTDYETQYKVTISDEVLMTEFLEQYEIIEQDGKIFTVREHKGE